MRRARGRRGFSLLEAVIAGTILAGAIGLALGVLGSMSEHVADATVSSDVRARANDAKKFLRSVLRGVVAVPGVSPPAPFAGPSPVRSTPHPTTNLFTRLQYVTATGFNPTLNSITISGEATLSFVVEGGETLNGADDDGDGLVDEGTLRWTRVGLPARDVATGVDGSTLAVRFLPATGAPNEGTATPLPTDVELLISFTVQGRGRQRGVVERVTETVRVGFRNTHGQD